MINKNRNNDSKTKHHDISRETLVRFDEGRKKLPGAPTKNQLRYWYKRGLLPRSESAGERVFLEPPIQIGGSLYTSVEAVGRFLKKLNEARSTETFA